MTESIHKGSELIDQDLPTGATPADGESRAPFQIHPYSGIAAEPFTAGQAAILQEPLDHEQVEIRPDGLLYLPEIRYRRILNRAFGPGAWALMPRSIDTEDNMLYYRGALFVHGRFVSEAIGEQQYYPSNDRMSYATAAESAKSNCLVRCCKDLGIASELWDPNYVREWLARNAAQVWCTNRQDLQKRKKFWRKKSAPAIDMWPWLEAADGGQVGRSEGREADAPVSDHGRQAAYSPATGNHDRRPISPRQAGRFRAISRVHDWKEREVQRLLAQHRFSSVEEITRDAYEGLCSILVDENELAKLRGRIQQEDVADDVLDELLR